MSCGAPNSPENVYCDACGRALADIEAVPGAALIDGRSRVPERLAAQIRTSRSDLEGERKRVTVLFADVAGSTKLARRAGSERWREIMARFFAIICEYVMSV